MTVRNNVRFGVRTRTHAKCKYNKTITYTITANNTIGRWRMEIFRIFPLHISVNPKSKVRSPFAPALFYSNIAWITGIIFFIRDRMNAFALWNWANLVVLPPKVIITKSNMCAIIVLIFAIAFLLYGKNYDLQIENSAKI